MNNSKTNSKKGVKKDPWNAWREFPKNIKWENHPWHYGTAKDFKKSKKQK